MVLALAGDSTMTRGFAPRRAACRQAHRCRRRNRGASLSGRWVPWLWPQGERWGEALSTPGSRHRAQAVHSVRRRVQSCEDSMATVAASSRAPASAAGSVTVHGIGLALGEGDGQQQDDQATRRRWPGGHRCGGAG